MKEGGRKCRRNDCPVRKEPRMRDKPETPETPTALRHAIRKRRRTSASWIPHPELSLTAVPA